MKKNETPEQKIKRACDSIIMERQHWECINQYGCNDPFWADDDAMFELSGANINAGFGFVHNFDCEVVGNIFDNPELLGNDDMEEEYL